MAKKRYAEYERKRKLVEAECDGVHVEPRVVEKRGEREYVIQCGACGSIWTAPLRPIRIRGNGVKEE